MKKSKVLRPRIPKLLENELIIDGEVRTEECYCLGKISHYTIHDQDAEKVVFEQVVFSTLCQVLE
ncbi:hypothetical protein [Sporolactobacillus laevolacticus]|uniref:hypothetical protein n=1 Tax=Sporolactobacillus laevolacticus TaxID=33018 RepID=UPI001269022C|nr:hypothetical protein [Sporolactobacillus laevolacticus]